MLSLYLLILTPTPHNNGNRRGFGVNAKNGHQRNAFSPSTVTYLVL